MGNLKVKEATADLIALVNNDKEVRIYNKGFYEKRRLGELADIAIKKINSK